MSRFHTSRFVKLREGLKEKLDECEKKIKELEDKKAELIGMRDE